MIAKYWTYLAGFLSLFFAVWLIFWQESAEVEQNLLPAAAIFSIGRAPSA
jgi:hypothetical protein